MRALALIAPVLLTTLLAAPRPASAFCGFYVSGGDAKLYNNATLVVLMRDGTRTVLSMQNNYQGPPEDFALVIPVPEVLQKDRVKTLDRGVFDRVDQLAAPRLVEYWERDPCLPFPPEEEAAGIGGLGLVGTGRGFGGSGDGGVKIEAQFTVGEYDVVILSAKEATGLDRWLRSNDYKIPEGAEPVLRPYVQSGMKFFVAKVDPKKVKFDANGQAMLSPLRFHYDSDSFNLPVRLGLINSAGEQDLLVHVLADKRYEVANYPNAFIPTNLEVKDNVREEFGKFYVALLDAVLKQTPKAVITEYSWQANNCDPCPQDPLSAEELVTLGADVLPKFASQGARDPWRMPGQFVLTRLHARYGKDTLGEDLVFREAKSVEGGRESGPAFKQPQGAADAEVNNFQARYIIRHPWTGPVACKDPQYGNWGGPPGGQEPKPKAAQNLAFVERTGSLGMYVAQDVPAVQFVAAAGSPPPADTRPDAKADTRPDAKADAKPESTAPPVKSAAPAGCGCASASDPRGAFLLLGLLALRRRRR